MSIHTRQTLDFGIMCSSPTGKTLGNWSDEGRDNGPHAYVLVFTARFAVAVTLRLRNRGWGGGSRRNATDGRGAGGGRRRRRSGIKGSGFLHGR